MTIIMLLLKAESGCKSPWLLKYTFKWQLFLRCSVMETNFSSNLYLNHLQDTILIKDCNLCSIYLAFINHIYFYTYKPYIYLYI